MEQALGTRAMLLPLVRLHSETCGTGRTSLENKRQTDDAYGNAATVTPEKYKDKGTRTGHPTRRQAEPPVHAAACMHGIARDCIWYEHSTFTEVRLL